MARQGGVEEVVDGLGKRTALFFILFKYNQQKGKYELGYEFKRVVICFVTSMRQKKNSEPSQGITHQTLRFSHV